MNYRDYTVDDIKKELAEVEYELGKFPSSTFLRKDHHTLLNAIYKNKFSIRDFGTIPNAKKPDGYWKNFENLSQAIRPLVKNNIFPTLKIITKHIPSAQTGVDHFGGMAALAKMMGCEIASFYYASDGHRLRSSYEFLVDEYLFSRKINHEVDGRICKKSKFRFDFKLENHFVEIWGYRGNEIYNNKVKVKKKLYHDESLRLISIEPELFNNKFDEIDLQLDEIFKNAGYDTKLKENDYSMYKCAKICSFWNLSRVIEEINVIIDDIGHFPLQEELPKGGINSAIYKYAGGMNNLRTIMGYPIENRTDYWNDESIKKELILIKESIGKIPTTTILLKMEREDLLSAMKKRKGVKYYQNVISK